MEEALLREIAQEHLVPFFSGAKLADASRPSSSREKTVAYLSPLSIAFKLERDASYRLVLTRSQPFRSEETTDVDQQGNVVSELLVVRATPILLTHTPTRCRVIPVAGIKLGIGRRRCVASDAEQRTEGVERVEAPVEPKREFVEVGL